MKMLWILTLTLSVECTALPVIMATLIRTITTNVLTNAQLAPLVTSLSGSKATSIRLAVMVSLAMISYVAACDSGCEECMGNGAYGKHHTFWNSFISDPTLFPTTAQCTKCSPGKYLKIQNPLWQSFGSC